MEILEKKVGQVIVSGPYGRLDAFAAGEVEKIMNPWLIPHRSRWWLIWKSWNTSAALG